MNAFNGPGAFGGRRRGGGTVLRTDPATKLVVATTKGKYATGARSAASLDSSITRQLVQIGPAAMTELRLEVNNWWLLANATEEQVNSGALGVEAALVDLVSGAMRRFKFSGANAGQAPVTAGAARATSDALAPGAFGRTLFPEHSRWLLVVRRTAASSSDALPWHGTNQSLTRELEYEYQYASATSGAAAIAAAYLDAAPALQQYAKDGANAPLGGVTGPVRPNSGASALSVAGGLVLLGRANGPTRAIAFLGDSIADGTQDLQTPQPTDAGNGWIGRALVGADGLPVASALKATMGGDRAQYAAGVNALRRNAFAQCTAAVIALGVNDLAGGRAAAQVTADLTTLAGLARAQGAARVIGVCVTPKTNAANTAPVAGFEPGGARDQVNAFIRTNAAFDDVIDFGPVVEAAGTGLWANAALTADGTHPLEAGHALMADVARAKLAGLPLAIV